MYYLKYLWSHYCSKKVKPFENKKKINYSSITDYNFTFNNDILKFALSK